MSVSAMLALLESAPVAPVKAPATVDGSEGKPLVWTIHPEVKILDAKKGIVRYIASDESLDSYREIVAARGWRFDRFKKNAPFVDSHNYATLGNLVGMVINYEVKGSQLIEDVQWAIDVQDNDLARLGFQMTEAGYLKAVSVGFIPVRYVSRYSGDEKDFTDAVKALNLAAETAALARVIYLEQQQIELSACIIGANGNAVAKAFAGGALSDEDLDKLADIGEKTLSEPVTHKNGPAPVMPAHDAEATRQERAQWLTELRQLTNRV